jgi:hypothetical protein
VTVTGEDVDGAAAGGDAEGAVAVTVTVGAVVDFTP